MGGKFVVIMFGKVTPALKRSYQEENVTGKLNKAFASSVSKDIMTK